MSTNGALQAFGIVDREELDLSALDALSLPKDGDAVVVGVLVAALRGKLASV